MGCGLAGGQANHSCLHSATVIQQQRTAETGGFIIGMGGHTKQTEHRLILIVPGLQNGCTILCNVLHYWKRITNLFLLGGLRNRMVGR